MNDPCATVRCLSETTTPPWLVWTEEPLELAARVFWSDDPRNAQLSIPWLDGARMRSPSDAWSEFSAALQFPYWFGRNWNALADCLGDLDWEHRRSYLLIVRNANSLLLDDKSDALKYLLDLLTRVGETASQEYQQSFDQRRPPTPFHVLFLIDVGERLAWKQRLETLGLDVPNWPLRNPAGWP